jgi:hypothetical protein
MNTPPTPQVTVPGLFVRYRYTHGEFSHLWSYVHDIPRMQAARHLAMQSHCAAVDLCSLTSSVGLLTGCKAFDTERQGSITGNVISNTLLGQHIRPRRETRCNGYEWEPSHLQNTDLKVFTRLDRIGTLSRYVRHSSHFEADGGVAYLIMHMRTDHGRHHPVVHGGLVTDRHRKRLVTWSAGELGHRGSPKSAQIMDTVTPFLTDEIAINRQPYYRAAIVL